jgi:hypothetical protein
MKRLVFVFLLLLSILSFAANKSVANAADYTINVHVTASCMQIDVMPCPQRFLNVVVDGKNYEVVVPTKCNDNKGILALGDYKAKLVKDAHPTAYQSLQNLRSPPA